MGQGVGSTVIVYFDPANPEEFVDDIPDWGNVKTGVFLMIVFTVIAVFT